MSGRFEGRVVYLTGGGSGLGRALVERFRTGRFIDEAAAAAVAH